MSTWTRREFLGTLGAAGAMATTGRAWSLGDRSSFRWAQIRYPGRWNPRVTGPARLLWEVVKRTSVSCSLKTEQVSLGSDRLSEFPFLFLSGDKALPRFGPAELARLRRQLGEGGTLFIEDADPREGSTFDQSVRSMVRALLPGERLQIAPSDHVIHKSFYLLAQPVGRLIHKPYIEVVERDQRALVIYSQNDACGAWCRDGAGNWEYDVQPGGARQREMAFRFGVNVVMYALCGNYKRDQVHVPFLLRRRRP